MPQIDRFALHLAAKGLTLGEQYRELYEGDLTVQGTGERDSLSADITFNEDQRLRLDVTGAQDTGHAVLRLNKWSRPDLLAVVPKEFRTKAQMLSALESLSASADCVWQDETVRVTGNAAPVFAAFEGPKETVAIEASAEASTSEGESRALTANLSARFRDQGVRVSLEVESKKHYIASLRLDEVAPGDWSVALAEERVLQALDTRLRGTIRVTSGSQPSRIHLNLDVSASPFNYMALSIPDTHPVTLLGSLDADLSKTSHVFGEELGLSIGNIIALHVEDWQLSLDDYAAAGSYTGDLALDGLGSFLPLKDLWGTAQVKGSFHNKKGVWTVKMGASAEPLGYGDFAAPYGTPVALEGTVAFDSLGRRATGSSTVIRVGEETSFAADTWQFLLDPLEITAPIAVETDLMPLVDMGYLDEATARAEGTCTLEYGAGGLKAKAAGRMQAALLVPAGAWAALENIEATVSGVYGTAFEAEGSFSLGRATVAGAQIENLACRVLAEDKLIRTEDLRGTLYGGTLEAGVRVEPFAAGFPARLSVRLMNVNLQALTEELELGSVKLTGSASGALVVRIHAGGLAALQAELKSTEGFSIDRSTVRKALMADATGGMTAGKQLSRLAEKVVGEAEQRPFDRAVLTMRLEHGVIQWRGRLESPDLNLTVDSDRGLEPAELYRALKRYQTLQLEKLDQVHAESVDFGE